MATTAKKTKTKSSTKTRAASTAKKLSGAKKAPAKKKTSTPTTTITVKYDAGFPNTLFLRGTGASLDWDKGIPLKNVGADEWKWSTRRKFDSAEFKILVNDQLFELGDNHSICCGDKVTIEPRF